jgi:hypothetical protein
MEVTVFNGHIEDDFFNRFFTDEAVGFMVFTDDELSFVHLLGLADTFQVLAVSVVAIAFNGLEFLPGAYSIFCLPCR